MVVSKTSVAVMISRRRDGGVSRVIFSSEVTSESLRLRGALGAIGVLGGGIICLIGVVGGSQVPWSGTGDLGCGFVGRV